MQKKYTGKEVDKILYQKTINTIEDNIKYTIPTLRVMIVNGMKCYKTLEVINIIDSTINVLESNQIFKEIKNIKDNIENLMFILVENEKYYYDFEVSKVLDCAINDLVRKIFY